jgi:hypothetical protein
MAEDLFDERAAEELLRWRPGTVDDPTGFDTWRERYDVKPGQRASVPTTEAFVAYRRFAESVGAVPLEPFAFARLMGGLFDKRRTSFVTDRRRVSACFLMRERGARYLRAASAEHPPTPADRALFTFTALRAARRQET